MGQLMVVLSDDRERRKFPTWRQRIIQEVPLNYANEKQFGNCHWKFSQPCVIVHPSLSSHLTWPDWLPARSQFLFNLWFDEFLYQYCSVHPKNLIWNTNIKICNLSYRRVILYQGSPHDWVRSNIILASSNIYNIYSHRGGGGTSLPRTNSPLKPLNTTNTTRELCQF